MTARPLFRPEAVQYRASREDDADILRLDVRWPTWTYRIILVAAVVAVAFVALVPVREYASGPAVVRVDGLRVVTAIVPGS